MDVSFGFRVPSRKPRLCARIQLQGYANEELAWITYDLNNANGSVSNQSGFMTGAIFDTNSFTYTNDSFKCFDLVLASGANTVTLHAADLAGNLTTSNFVFNLNYSNKPAPVVQLWWPQNGAQISGSSFTWRGTVDDPTVTLSAQITDTNGDVNVVAGMIERNGNFWVDNLPLAPGTNWLTLTATDINNNTNTTNIYVVQSSVALNITSMDPITTQSAITVNGTISTNNYTVWVNGVLVTNINWNGSVYVWSANNVPVNGAGSAVVQACAIPDIGNDGNGNGTGPGGGGTTSSLSNPGNPFALDAVDEENDPDKLPALYCSYFRQNWAGELQQLSNPGLSPSVIENDSATTTWNSATGGTTTSNQCTMSYGTNGLMTLQLSSVFELQWAPDGLGTMQYGGATNAGCGNVANLGPPTGYLGPTGFPGLQGGCVYATNYYIGNTPTAWNSSQQAASKFLLQTGGRSLPGVQSLHAIEALAWAFQPPVYDDIYEDWLGQGVPDLVYIPPQQVTILGVPENSDGNVWVSLPDGDQVDVTPQAQGVPFYVTTPVEIKYAFVPQCLATFPTNQIRTNIGVGEIVNLSYQPITINYFFAPTLPPDTQWSNTAGSLAYTNWPVNVFTAPGSAGTVTITTIPGGYGGGANSTTFPGVATIKKALKAAQPTNVVVVTNNGAPYGGNFTPLVPGMAGAQRGFLLRVMPENPQVSWSFLYFRELPGPATNVSNYFANTNIYTMASNAPPGLTSLYHGTAGNWYSTHDDSVYNDSVWSPAIYPPYSAGSFQWVITNQWTMNHIDSTNNLFFITTQTCTVDTNGTVTITKFGDHGVRRTADGTTTNLW